MAKTSKTTENQPEKTTMEKIGESVSHLKEIIIEQKDKLVEAVEHKAADLKVAIKNFKKRKKSPPKKTAKKTAVKAAKKVAAKVVKKSAKKVVKKAVKKAVKKVVKKAKPVSKKKK